jgi:hypothetical protein
MGAPEMREPHTPEEEHGETWERLMRAVAACQQTGMFAPEEDPTVLAIGLWSLVEGLAQLWCTGPLPELPQAASGLAPLTDSVIRAMFAGMRPARALPAASSTASAAS